MNDRIKVFLIKLLGETIGFLKGLQFEDNAYHAREKVKEFCDVFEQKFSQIILEMHDLEQKDYKCGNNSN